MYFAHETTPVRPIPVISGANEKDCFPIFADVHSSVHVFDARREPILMDGASIRLHPTLVDHKVSITW